MKNVTKQNGKRIVNIKTHQLVSAVLFLTALLAATLFLTLLVSCSKDDTPPGPNPTSNQPIPVLTPTLSSISPESGPKTTIVTINGSNFGTDPDEVQVFFNDKEAEVQTVNNTQIKAVVPPKAFSGVVEVVIKDTNLTGPTFNYIITDVQVSTLAGGTQGFANGTGTSAQFSAPWAVAMDIDGNIYVADVGNHKIRKVTPSGTVSTLAGSTQGFADGTGENAQFNFIQGVAVDGEGNVYVADTGNHKIRKVTPSGVVSTLAGSTQGFADGTGGNAQFKSPEGVAVDANGNVYVADSFNNKIRKVTSNGSVSTLAGSTQGFADGMGTSAQFSIPSGVALGMEGDLYVADSFNNKIRKITPNGMVSTLAGSTQGFADGAGVNAQFDRPFGLTVDTEGNVYVADTNNYKIRKITPSGMVSTLAGGNTYGFEDGTGANAKFDDPLGIVVDAERNLNVADKSNHRIRKITQE
ncbi:IPT/TIG domain-containing protein [Flavobacteriaceae bacterium 3-367]